MRNKTAGLVLLIGAVFSVTSHAGEKLKIGWVFAMANAPILIAQAKGYFKDEGLDVEIVQFNSGPLVHQALSAGPQNSVRLPP